MLIALKNGYNPFDEEQQVVNEIKVIEEKQLKRSKVATNKENFTILHAIDVYLKFCEERGLSQATMRRYYGHSGLLKEWLSSEAMLLYKATEIMQTI